MFDRLKLKKKFVESHENERKIESTLLCNENKFSITCDIHRDCSAHGLSG